MSDSQKDPIINDAIHGVMRFPKDTREIIKGIVDTPSFQRLRHIKQLGMTDLVFPSALHSRFSHSFGAAYIAYRMGDILNLEEKNLQYAIVSALLHDIGHGPFSHAFEKILVQDKDNKIDHEDWTSEFLERNFKNILESKGFDLKVIKEIISGTYVKNYNQEVRKDNKNTINIVADIISSQLDADRLDYLLRDSHFCGVPMGKVDIDWIISNLTTIDRTEYPPRLGIYKKGVRAVEHFLIGRKLFYQTVCFHPKIRIFEEILKYFLIAVSASTEKNTSEVVSNNDLEIFLKNINKYKDKINKSEFIRENFKYYSNLTDMDIWVFIKNYALGKDSPVTKLAKLIYERKPHNFKNPRIL